MYALINSKIYTGHSILVDHVIVISDGLIRAIFPIKSLSKKIKTYNLYGLNVAPGFIDLQINGCGGVQFNDDINSISTQTLEKMQITNRNHGCTSFLPTLITSSDLLIQKAVEVTRDFLKHHKNQVLGLHLEGPFINPKKKGIHNPMFIRSPTISMVHYLCNNSDIVKKITLAPEQLNMTTIEQLKTSGIHISIGHSNASYQETQLSFSFGITCATHIFNAMPPITAREPGVIGAIFDNPNIYCSIIADGIHVHWINIKYTKKIKGNHLILITDGTSPAGCNHITSFIFSGKTIFHHNKICQDDTGILSGSSLTMIQAVKNSVQHANIPLDEALRMATLYPAQFMGIDNILGSLTVNKIANLIVFDQNYEIKKTIVNGCIYNINS